MIRLVLLVLALTVAGGPTTALAKQDTVLVKLRDAGPATKSSKITRAAKRSSRARAIKRQAKKPAAKPKPMQKTKPARSELRPMP
ncbi:MAG: hypothetical protein H0T89_13940 [Deltaproteobacteria bacterium]|nr:hypothetical protein [Deltaproteobacteria bacterium]MDQ3297425.1 hypothetical protein [Myxococcota bacterium]